PRHCRHPLHPTLPSQPNPPTSFLSPYVDNPHLHSFPTRRSSDLDGIARLGGSAEKINPLVPVHLVIDHSVMVDEFGTPRGLIFRSEEHTSELQSRGHLVCRLLLEKKKMQVGLGFGWSCGRGRDLG